MTPAPWADPELTSRGRLPMHAVPHDDRAAARRHAGGSSCSTGPTDAVGAAAWRDDRRPRLLDDAGHLGPAASTRTSRCRSPTGRPRPPTRTRPASTSGRSRCPAAWAGRRVVLHVGAAESVLIVELNGGEIGISKDSHLAAEFDVTALPAAGRERPAADGREVVRRVVRRGPGPVVARRHHAPRVPVRDGRDVPRGPRDRRRASRPTARPARCRSRSALGWSRRPAAQPAGGSRRRSRAWTEPLGAVVRPRAAAARRRPATGSCPGRRAAASSTSRASSPPARSPRPGRRRALARGRARSSGRRASGGCAWRPASRASSRGPRSSRRSYRLAVSLRRARRRGRRAGRAADRVPAGRGPRRRAAGQRPGRADPGRQPPRLRPADRPRRRARGHARRRASR